MLPHDLCGCAAAPRPQRQGALGIRREEAAPAATRKCRGHICMCVSAAPVMTDQPDVAADAGQLPRAARSQHIDANLCMCV